MSGTPPTAPSGGFMLSRGGGAGGSSWGRFAQTTGEVGSSPSPLHSTVPGGAGVSDEARSVQHIVSVGMGMGSLLVAAAAAGAVAGTARGDGGGDLPLTPPLPTAAPTAGGVGVSFRNRATGTRHRRSNEGGGGIAGGGTSGVPLPPSTQRGHRHSGHSDGRGHTARHELDGSSGLVPDGHGGGGRGPPPPPPTSDKPVRWGPDAIVPTSRSGAMEGAGVAAARVRTTTVQHLPIDSSLLTPTLPSPLPQSTPRTHSVRALWRGGEGAALATGVSGGVGADVVLCLEDDVGVPGTGATAIPVHAGRGKYGGRRPSLFDGLSTSSEGGGDERAVTAAALAMQSTLQTTTALMHGTGPSRPQTKAQMLADLPAFLRLRCRELLLNPWFDRVILVIIAASCVFLALDAPNVSPDSVRGRAITTAQLVFTVLFSLEAGIKMMALGVNPINPDTYFRSWWNCLDFAIVVESIVNGIIATDTGNLSALRAVRALRPLRTVTRIGRLRAIIDGIVRSLPLLGNICLLMVFFFVLWGTAAVRLWAGAFHQRCYLPGPDGRWEGGDDVQVGGPDDLCGGFASCPEGAACLAVGPAPEYGYGVLHFDDLLHAAIVLFAAVSREGWTIVMSFAQDTTTVWAWAFFVPMMVTGSFILIQLALAVIMSSYSESRARQEAEALREVARREALLRVRKMALQEDQRRLTQVERRRRASGSAMSLMPRRTSPGVNDGRPITARRASPWDAASSARTGTLPATAIPFRSVEMIPVSHWSSQLSLLTRSVQSSPSPPTLPVPRRAPEVPPVVLVPASAASRDSVASVAGMPPASPPPSGSGVALPLSSARSAFTASPRQVGLASSNSGGGGGGGSSTSPLPPRMIPATTLRRQAGSDNRGSRDEEEKRGPAPGEGAGGGGGDGHAPPPPAPPRPGLKGGGKSPQPPAIPPPPHPSGAAAESKGSRRDSTGGGRGGGGMGGDPELMPAPTHLHHHASDPVDLLHITVDVHNANMAAHPPPSHSTAHAHVAQDVGGDDADGGDWDGDMDTTTTTTTTTTSPSDLDDSHWATSDAEEGEEEEGVPAGPAGHDMPAAMAWGHDAIAAAAAASTASTAPPPVAIQPSLHIKSVVRVPAGRPPFSPSTSGGGGGGWGAPSSLPRESPPPTHSTAGMVPPVGSYGGGEGGERVGMGPLESEMAALYLRRVPTDDHIIRSAAVADALMHGGWAEMAVRGGGGGPIPPPASSSPHPGRHRSSSGLHPPATLGAPPAAPSAPRASTQLQRMKTGLPRLGLRSSTDGAGEAGGDSGAGNPGHTDAGRRGSLMGTMSDALTSFFLGAVTAGGGAASPRNRSGSVLHVTRRASTLSASGGRVMRGGTLPRQDKDDDMADEAHGVGTVAAGRARVGTWRGSGVAGGEGSSGAGDDGATPVPAGMDGPSSPPLHAVWKVHPHRVMVKKLAHEMVGTLGSGGGGMAGMGTPTMSPSDEAEGDAPPPSAFIRALMQVEQVVCPPRSPCVRWWQQHVSDTAFLILHVPLINYLIIGAVIANTVTLAITHHGMSSELSAGITQANYAFVAIFALELVLNLAAYGLSGFFADSFRVFDGIVVILSIVDALPMTTTVGLSALRLTRLLRIFRVARNWKSMQAIVAVAVKTLPSFGWTAILLALVLFIFSVLGLQLFGSAYANLAGPMPQHNFSTLHNCFLVVFTLLVGEGLDTIIYQSLSITTTAAIVYFVVWMVLGQYILLNLFLALLLDGFTETDTGAKELERRDEFKTAVVLIDASLQELKRRGVGESVKNKRILFASALQARLDAVRRRNRRGSSMVSMNSASGCAHPPPLVAHVARGDAPAMTTADLTPSVRPPPPPPLRVTSGAIDCGAPLSPPAVHDMIIMTPAGGVKTRIMPSSPLAAFTSPLVTGLTASNPMASPLSSSDGATPAVGGHDAQRGPQTGQGGDVGVGVEGTSSPTPTPSVASSCASRTHSVASVPTRQSSAPVSSSHRGHGGREHGTLSPRSLDGGHASMGAPVVGTGRSTRKSVISTSSGSGRGLLPRGRATRGSMAPGGRGGGLGAGSRISTAPQPTTATATPSMASLVPALAHTVLGVLHDSVRVKGGPDRPVTPAAGGGGGDCEAGQGGDAGPHGHRQRTPTPSGAVGTGLTSTRTMTSMATGTVVGGASPHPPSSEGEDGIFEDASRVLTNPRTARIDLERSATHRGVVDNPMPGAAPPAITARNRVTMAPTLGLVAGTGVGKHDPWPTAAEHTDAPAHPNSLAGGGPPPVGEGGGGEGGSRIDVDALGDKRVDDVHAGVGKPGTSGGGDGGGWHDDGWEVDEEVEGEAEETWEQRKQRLDRALPRSLCCIRGGHQVRQMASWLVDPDTILFRIPTINTCLRQGYMCCWSGRHRQGRRSTDPGGKDGMPASMGMGGSGASGKGGGGLRVSFEHVIMTTILLSTLLLAVECPQTQHVPHLMTALKALEAVFLVIFCVEVVCKVVAHGFIAHPGAYLRDGYNRLDFAVVVTAAVDLIATSAGGGANISFLRVLRILRTLRPLRLLSRNKGMRLVTDALYFSAWPILNIVAVLALLFTIFAIAGVQLFSGAMADCNDPEFPPDTPLSNCTGPWPSDPTRQRAVVTPPQNFDNFPNALLHLFIVSTGENWPEVMYRVGDITEPGRSGLRGNTWYYSYFHVVFIFICVFVGLNLFVAVLYANFVTLSRSMEGVGLLTERQREWLEAQKVLLRAKPIRLIAQPKNRCRRRLWLIGHSPLFHNIMHGVVAVNMALLAAQHWRQPAALTVSISAVNAVTVAALVVEALIKGFGFGSIAYFRTWWHRFDCVLIVLGLVDVMLTHALPGTMAAAAFAALCVLRGVRLAQAFPGISVLLATLVTSVPAFLNVGACLLLAVFCYAVAGVNLYGDMDLTELEALDRHANFQSVPNAMLILMRVATGEAWNELMYDTVNSDAGGGWHGYLYWLSYIMVVNFVTLQMFVMVVVDSFEREQQRRNGAAEEHIRAFRTVWRGFDPRGTGFIPLEDLRPLLTKLPPPMGLREGATFADYIRYVEQLGLMTWSRLVAFRDVLINVHRVTYGIGIPQDLLVMAGTMPDVVQEAISRKLRRKVARQRVRTRLAEMLAGRRGGVRREVAGALRTTRDRRGPLSLNPAHTSPSPPTSPLRTVSDVATGLRSVTVPPSTAARRAAFRMSQVERRAALEAAPAAADDADATRPPHWLASVPIVDQRRRQRDAELCHREEEARAAAAAAQAEAAELQRHQRERAEKHRLHYVGVRPTTAVGEPMNEVLSKQRIADSVREWRLHRAAREAAIRAGATGAT